MTQGRCVETVYNSAIRSVRECPNKARYRVTLPGSPEVVQNLCGTHANSNRYVVPGAVVEELAS